MKQFKFEATITFPDGDAPDEIDEDYIDLKALYYGDKHQDFVLNVIAGSIEEVTK